MHVELPEVLSIKPSIVHPLHTTRSQDFLGLDYTQSAGLLHRANYGDGVIIGIVDTGNSSSSSFMCIVWCVRFYLYTQARYIVSTINVPAWVKMILEMDVKSNMKYICRDGNFTHGSGSGYLWIHDPIDTDVGVTFYPWTRLPKTRRRYGQ